MTLVTSLFFSPVEADLRFASSNTVSRYASPHPLSGGKNTCSGETDYDNGVLLISRAA